MPTNKHTVETDVRRCNAILERANVPARLIVTESKNGNPKHLRVLHFGLNADGQLIYNYGNEGDYKTVVDGTPNACADRVHGYTHRVTMEHQAEVIDDLQNELAAARALLGEIHAKTEAVKYKRTANSRELHRMTRDYAQKENQR